MSIEDEAIAYLTDRIPALAALRGAALLEAEEAIRNAVADAIDDYNLECEMVCDNLHYARDEADRWRHIVMDIMQADEGGQGLPFAEAMKRANAALKQ